VAFMHIHPAPLPPQGDPHVQSPRQRKRSADCRIQGAASAFMKGCASALCAAFNAMVVLGSSARAAGASFLGILPQDWDEDREARSGFVL
jgi:hypothetical protein